MFDIFCKQYNVAVVIYTGICEFISRMSFVDNQIYLTEGNYSWKNVKNDEPIKYDYKFIIIQNL